LATALFATSAWSLHVSRLATHDVLYLWGMLLLLVSFIVIHRKPETWYGFFGSLLAWTLLIFTPGFIWLVGITAFWQRSALRRGWDYFAAWWQRGVAVCILLLPLAGLVAQLTRHSDLLYWLGLPRQWPGFLEFVKQFASVFVHLFVHGPHDPQLWLGKTPILDIFTLIAALAGIYFYGRNLQANRSRYLASIFGVGILLVSLGGAVSISLLVPLLYVCAATGIAFLLHDWLKTFPLNPFARTVGITLVAIAVSLACLYNLRAYFVAWPHNSETHAAFRYRP
jgi:hypothetical protein